MFLTLSSTDCPFIRLSMHSLYKYHRLQAIATIRCLGCKTKSGSQLSVSLGTSGNRNRVVIAGGVSEARRTQKKGLIQVLQGQKTLPKEMKLKLKSKE